MKQLPAWVRHPFVFLLGASSFGQALTIIATPVLTRLYSPVAFGIVAGILGVVALSQSVVHGRFHFAIPVAEQDEDARSLFALATLCNLLLALPVAWLFVQLSGEPDVGLANWFFLALCATLTVLTAQIEIFSYWQSRRERFRITGVNSVARAGSAVSLQAGFSPLGALGLVGGAIAGAAVSGLLSIIDLVRTRQSPKWLGPGAFVALAREYRRYPLFVLPQGLISAVFWNGMPLLLLRYADAVWAGYYWVAYRVFMAPIALFNASYRQSMLGTMSAQPYADARGRARRHTYGLLACMVIVVVAMQFAGAEIFGFALGEEWRDAGRLAGGLVLVVAGDVVKVPALCLCQSRSRLSVVLVWEGAIAVAAYAAALPALSAGDVMMGIGAFSLAGFLGWSAFAVYVLFGPAVDQADRA